MTPGPVKARGFFVQYGDGACQTDTVGKQANRIGRALSSLAGTAMVMVAWSELVFFNGDPAGTLALNGANDALASVRHLAALVGFYVIPAAVALAAVARFGATGPARAMLVGALVGFVIEAAIVPAAYEAPPVSFLWTSISWHGPVTVGLGLFLLPRLLATFGPLRMAMVSVLLGIVWGLWMPWTWAGETARPTTASTFLAFSVWTTGLMTLGYGLLGPGRWPTASLPTPALWLIGAGSVGLFLLNATAHPLAATGVASIVVAILAVLIRMGRSPAEAQRPAIRNLALLWLMPMVASGTYLLAVENGSPIPPDELPALAFLALTAV